MLKHKKILHLIFHISFPEILISDLMKLRIFKRYIVLKRQL